MADTKLATPLGEIAGDMLAGILEPDAAVVLTPGHGLATVPAADFKDKPPEPVVEKKEPVKEKEPEVKEKVIDPDEPPESLPNEGRSDTWKKFRESYTGKKKEVTELRDQLKEFEGTRKERDELKGRIEKLETENKELGKIDSLSKLENHPDFRRKYTEAEKTSVAKVRELSSYADVPADDLVAAMGKPPKERYAAIDDILGNVAPTLRAKIQKELDSIESIRDGRAAELANAQENLSKLNAAREQSERDYSKSRETAFEKVASKLAKELNLDDKATREAKDFFLNNDNAERAVEIILKEKAADLSIKEKKELQSKLEALEKEVADYRKGGGSLRAGETVKSTIDDPNEDITTRIRRLAKEQGAIR